MSTTVRVYSRGVKPSPALWQKVAQTRSYYSSLIVNGNVPGPSSWSLPALSQVPLGSSRGKIDNTYMSGMLFISSLWEASELSQVFPKTTFFLHFLKKKKKKRDYLILHNMPPAREPSISRTRGLHSNWLFN